MRAPRTLPLAILGSLALCAAGAACSAILGLEPPPVPADGGADAAPVDATTGDSTMNDGRPPDADAGVDVSVDAALDAALCVALDAGGDGATTYFPLSNVIIDDAGTRAWQFFEPSSVNTLSRDFQGGVYDGRYVYFTPSGSGTITRYDTHRSFSAGTSWSTFDTSTLAAGAQGYNGAVYDGRYVYFVPYRAPAGYDGLLVRYDTQGLFAGAAAWALFDLGALPVPDGGVAATGFAGGVFDGHEVYLAPDYDGVEHLSRVVRYDPDGAVPDAGDGGPRDAGDAGDAGNGGEAGPPGFGSASQFSLFDVSTRNASAAGFVGALFDGRYVYLVPYQNNASTSGILARYDTDASFGVAGAWTVIDTTAINAEAEGFVGAAFDGRYVYLVPHARTVVARYDTQAGLTLPNKAAWSTFDVSAIQPADAGALAFAGGAFDGRFVYFVPGSAAPPQGTVVRYDTWSAFGAPCAWSTHDVSQDVAGATNYYGAVYDGQFLYLVPKGTYVARFQTKTPASMPSLPGFNGSFY